MPATTDSLRYDIRELMKSGGFNEIVDRCHVELTLARREHHHSVEVIALLGLAQAQCALELSFAATTSIKRLTNREPLLRKG